MLTEADRVEGTTRHEDGVTGNALGVTGSSSMTINKVGKCRGTAYSFQEYLLPSQALCV
jgi:hypothetical protein